MRQLRNALTVAQLIEALQECNPEAKVVFTCDYGDHCHTQQALPLEEVRDLDFCERLENSAYSQSGLALCEYDPLDEGEPSKPQLVVVLK